MGIDLAKARALFLQAVESRPAEEWDRFLDEACRGDAELRGQVRALLEAHWQAGSFLAQGLLAPTVSVRRSPPREGPGRVIGPYKLLEEIGEGGMGTVFMAEQAEPVRRKVALKVIKPGMDSRQVVARFEAERQALALMDHPNIARVLDAGATDEGRPYFVMELVKGVPITRYCDEKCLTPRERLELFVPVCLAVQHAHQKGVIHRDLKPSNVLVAPYDGKPVPKVIDFGVAKDTGQTLTEKTLFTGFGAVVGTPEYMSPEQAELNNQDVDTRSDVYSLGVLLYELLTGTTPLTRERVKDTALLEVLRLVREEEPPRPSTRLSTATDLASIAAARGLEPEKLSGLVRGELDWVVMKCLEKDRNRRYDSANGLALDLQRYLADELVLACPPSAGYRLRKLVRRNTAAFTTAALIAVVLVAATAVSAWLAVRAMDAEKLAEQRLGTEKEERGRAERAWAVAVANLKTTRRAIDQMLTRVADERLMYVPQMEEVRRELLEDALRFYRELERSNSDDPEIRLEVGLAYGRLGRVYFRLGRQAEADDCLRRSITLLNEPSARAALSPESRYTLVTVYTNLGWSLGKAGRTGEAEAARQEAVRRAEQLTADHPNVPEYRDLLARACIDLGNSRRAGDPAGAEALLRRAIGLSEGPGDSRHTRARAFQSLGELYGHFGRPREAESALRQARGLYAALVATQPKVWQHREQLGDVLLLLGRSLCAAGRVREAAGALREAVDLRARLLAQYASFAQNREDLVSAAAELVLVLTADGRTDEAGKVFERLRAEAPRGPRARADLAWLLATSPLPQVAAPSRAVELARQALGQVPSLDRARRALAAALLRTGDARAARGELKRLRTDEPLDGFLLAQAHARLADYDLARQAFDEAAARMDRQRPDDPELRRFRQAAEALLPPPAP
jgi:serine/threonine protein kinase/tetratricopeptide (TPR) repeat protein